MLLNLLVIYLQLGQLYQNLNKFGLGRSSPLLQGEEKRVRYSLSLCLTPILGIVEFNCPVRRIVGLSVAVNY